MSTTALDLLRLHWGHNSFRPLQQEIIDSVLDGNDTLALLPTGGGKSICYQIPALLKEGVCLVVSPLIALMNDQVNQLKERGIAAAALHSAMPYQELDRQLENAAYGNTKLLYLSPERLKTELVQERIKRMQVNLIAVDEAHCISQWGYDFRPSYLDIATIRQFLPGVPVLALTATATPEVVQDIQDKLIFTSSNVLRKSFERSNLAYVVRQTESKTDKLLDILHKTEGSGVVYTRNRRRTREIANLLRQNQISASYYHAGVEPLEKDKRQAAWMSGKTRVMVATNAFGMGIDKSNVRVVVHMDLPDSLEAYFQEAGRAGRDGQKAFAILLYQAADRIKMEAQLEAAFPTPKQIQQVYRALCNYFQLAAGSPAGTVFDFDLTDFCRRFNLPMNQTFHTLSLLQKEGWIHLTDAVFQPARLQILVNKDSLYDYQLRHPKLERILKTILRTYQGAFQQQIKLREGQLANFLQLKSAELQHAFTIMHRDRIIDYIPQKDKPQLLFLKERIQADHFSLDQKKYKEQKQRQESRLSQAIAYAEGKQCRPRFLLTYFGEATHSNCGQCDWCLEQQVPKLNNRRAKSIAEQVRGFLDPSKMPVQALLSHFPEEEHQQTLEVIEHLLETKQIVRRNNLLEWVSGSDR